MDCLEGDVQVTDATATMGKWWGLRRLIRLIRVGVVSCLHVVLLVLILWLCCWNLSCCLLLGDSVFRKSEWKKTLSVFGCKFLKLFLVGLVGLDLILGDHCGT